MILKIYDLQHVEHRENKLKKTQKYVKYVFKIHVFKNTDSNYSIDK